MNNDNMLC